MVTFPTALDPASPDVRVEFGLAEAEFARQSINRATAAQIAAIHGVLREARETPRIYVGPHALSSNREHVEFAERAAIADLAVRLSVSENTIRAFDAQATTMIMRTPRTWSAFRGGQVSPANARVVAELAATLPDDDAVLKQFDDAVTTPARDLAPARFSTRARGIRERLHAEAASERHARRVDDRRVRFTPDVDGMAWIEAFVPGDVATRLMAHLDATAFALASNPAEERTMDQLRTDELCKLLLGDGTSTRVGVRVGVVVPVMTLLGLSEEPAILDGYGPIDAATARRLTAEAPSFYRVLTHPITGTVLDLDRVTLRVPADMKRWLQLRDQVCTFPGCGRRAARCDLDHTVDRQFGGTTKVTNLSHLCRKHHRAKHMTRWKVAQSRDGTIEWTSPTGFVRAADPPPF
ncbi:MAG: hypothetical protein JWP85_1164 [Rhodoglobus sp.]|nr:hypothetical protein [Rhodoglobus sp.]